MTIVLAGNGAEIIAYANLLKENNRRYQLLLTSAVGAGDFLKFTQIKQQTDFTLITSQRALKRHISKIPDIEYVFCFGLRWIIKKEILSITPNWYNLNAIPIPNYLGGAHVSWQILHNYNRSAIVVQKIEQKVDRGKVIFAKYFAYSNHCRLPSDFLLENLRKFDKHKRQIYQLLDRNEHKEFRVDWEERVYLPRLYTPINSWIDWEWKGGEIERWVRAFSHPYKGARSNIRAKRFQFHDAHFTPKVNSHPFTSGVIVRLNRAKGTIVVGVKDGLIALQVSSESAKKIKVGQRFYTPANRLRRSRKFQAKSIFFDKNWRFLLRANKEKLWLITHYALVKLKSSAFGKDRH